MDRVSINWILLLSATCLYFSDYAVTSNSVAASACPKSHPGHLKCRAIEADCYLSGDDYECLCSEGYWMHEGKCRKSDWCADGDEGDIACKSNGTTCKNLEWNSDTQNNVPYKCECESKYVNNYRICSVTDWYCSLKGAKSVKHGDITMCDCNQNSFFDYSASKCQNLDICPFVQCRGKYEECQGGKCVCQTGYEWINMECKPKNYCLSSDVCGTAKCEEGPADDPKRIRCYCDSGYVLARDRATPYCKLVRCQAHSLNPCDHICLYSKDKKSSYCECLNGHILKPDGFTCEIQASYKCSYNICNSKSICVNMNGTDQCMCKNSLVGEGSTCTDRCAAGLLGDICPGKKCKSTENGFQCVCEGKYRLSENQVTCEERQMCVKGEEGFLNCSQQNRTCIDSPEAEEGFTCGECLPGLLEQDGKCSDPRGIEENKSYCEDKGGTYVSVNEVTGEPICRCPPLSTWKKNVGCVFARYSYTGALMIVNDYKLNNASVRIWYGEDDINWKKLDHDIGKSMSALFGQALSGVNVISCSAAPSLEDPEAFISCEIELQLHFKNDGILERLNAPFVCRRDRSIPEMFCFIPPYLKLVPSQGLPWNVEVFFRESDVCYYGSSVCPATTKCVPEDVGFSCRCAKGFFAKRAVFLNSDKTGLIEICQDVDECSVSDYCPNGTICINTMGDFRCDCKLGLYRRNLSGSPKLDICTEACDQVNCNHGTCETHDLGFHCRCFPGYSGAYCEEKISGIGDHSGMGRTAIVAVGVVEAIICIVLIVLVIILYKYRIWRSPKPNEQRINRGSKPRNVHIMKANIDHIHMRGTERANGVPPSPLQEEPDEPIYADCAHIR